MSESRDWETYVGSEINLEEDSRDFAKIGAHPVPISELPEDEVREIIGDAKGDLKNLFVFKKPDGSYVQTYK